MTIWFARYPVATAGLAALGYQQGAAIRTGITFSRIISALPPPAGGTDFRSLLGLLASTSPGPCSKALLLCGFALLLAPVKVGAFFVHQKVDVYYKYKAGDLRLALWEGLNA